MTQEQQEQLIAVLSASLDSVFEKRVKEDLSNSVQTIMRDAELETGDTALGAEVQEIMQEEKDWFASEMGDLGAEIVDEGTNKADENDWFASEMQGLGAEVQEIMASDASDSAIWNDDQHHGQEGGKRGLTGRHGKVLEVNFGLNNLPAEAEVQEACNSVRTADESLHDWSDDAVRNLLMYHFPGVENLCRQAEKNPKTDRHTNMAYKSDTCVVNGQETPFTRVMEVPNWDIDLQECMTNDDRARNLDIVRNKITNCLYEYYGGFTRFNSIVVQGYQLIINGTCYMPKLSKSCIEKFPFDTVDYIQNGCLAPFLDWGYLSKMINLSELHFDDVGFVMSYVRSDLGESRNFTPVKLFNVCRNLTTLEVAGELVTYPVENPVIEEECQAYSRADIFYEKYKSAVCDGVFGGVRRWTVNNLVNYANNRGDKGLFRYCGGILLRTVPLVGAGTVEVAGRVGGGIVHGVTNLFGKAMKSARAQGSDSNQGGF